MRSRRAVVLVLAACAALTLSACTTPAASDPDAVVESVEPSPLEPTEADANLPAFGESIVVVTARATASNGAVLDLELTAYEPVTADSADAAAILAYLAAQGDTSAITTGTVIADEQPLLMPFAISAVLSGDTPWPAGEGALTTLGDRGEVAIVGIPAERLGSQADFSIVGAGEGFAVNTISNNTGEPISANQWADRFGYYGFDQFSSTVALSMCSIVVSPYAQQFDVVATQWDVIECFVGVSD